MPRRRGKFRRGWNSSPRIGQYQPKIAEENLEELRKLLIRTLEPWSAQHDAEKPTEAAARTADWLIAVTFGYATVTALRSADRERGFRSNLVRAARSLNPSKPDPG